MPISGDIPPLKAKAPARAAKTIGVTAERESALAELGGLAQVPLIALRQYADAGTVSMHWPNIATELALLAEKQPQVAKVIDPLRQVGPYAGIITAVLPLILQVGVNHGRVNPGAMGTVPATVISAQVESNLAVQELEALKIQRDAEKQARDMRAQIDEARAESAREAA